MVLYSCYCLGHFRISGVLVGFHSEMKRAMCIVELYNHTGIFTREMCGEARAEGKCHTHFSSVLKNSQVLI